MTNICTTIHTDTICKCTQWKWLLPFFVSTNTLLTYIHTCTSNPSTAVLRLLALCCKCCRNVMLGHSYTGLHENMVHAVVHIPDTWYAVSPTHLPLDSPNHPNTQSMHHLLNQPIDPLAHSFTFSSIHCFTQAVPYSTHLPTQPFLYPSTNPYIYNTTMHHITEQEQRDKWHRLQKSNQSTTKT